MCANADVTNCLLGSRQMSPTSATFRIYETILRPTALYGCVFLVLNKIILNILTIWKEDIGWKTEGGNVRRTNEDAYDIYSEPETDVEIRLTVARLYR